MVMTGATSDLVLLTGFGPFPGAPENVSADLVRAVVPRLRRALPHIVFAAQILPTEWDGAARRLERLYQRRGPILVLHFGISSKATSLVIETQGLNECRALPDAKGQLPLSNGVIPAGPARLKATLPAETIARGLRAGGIPSVTSRDAGGYLCNAVLYHSLHWARSANRKTRVGFIHLPANLARTPDRPRGVPHHPAGHLTWEKAIAGAVKIVHLSLEPARTSRHRQG